MAKLTTLSFNDMKKKYIDEVGELFRMARDGKIEDVEYLRRRKSVLRQSQRLRKSDDPERALFGDTLKRMVMNDLPTKSSEQRKLREQFPKEKIDELVKQKAAPDITKKVKSRVVRDYDEIRKSLQDAQGVIKNVFADSGRNRRIMFNRTRAGAVSEEAIRIEERISAAIHKASADDRLRIGLKLTELAKGGKVSWGSIKIKRALIDWIEKRD